ncbi:MAG: DNA recombination protein RmuC, partial [Alistipes sp.]|nr:DNA recombination protein RmuC [Alistipes sp.]
MSAASFIVGRRTRPANADAAKCSDLEAQLAESKEQLAKSEERLEALRSEAITLRSERDIERTSRQHLEEQVSTIKLEAKETLEAHTAALKESHDKQIAHLREEQQRQMDEFKALNKKQLDDQLELIREQMRTTSETVLKARQEELGERNVEQVSKIVDPLRQSLKQMQEALNSSSKEHNETMTRLDATIQANMKNSRDLGETAERLTRALVGEVKVQGNFGELKLRQLLEDLGLKEGEQYSTQESLKDEFGASIKDDEAKGLIPDFVLHFPNN